MFQTIICNCSDMNDCDQKNPIKLLKITRFNQKLTWEETAIIEKIKGFKTFGTIQIEYSSEFSLLKSQVLRCVE